MKEARRWMIAAGIAASLVGCKQETSPSSDLKKPIAELPCDAPEILRKTASARQENPRHVEKCLQCGQACSMTCTPESTISGCKNCGKECTPECIREDQETIDDLLQASLMDRNGNGIKDDCE